MSPPTHAEWSQVVALAGLPPGASASDVITGLAQRVGTREAARIARETRAAAIAGCHRCDPNGWRLGPDGPLEPALRCDHSAITQRPAGHHPGEPLHEREP